MSRLRDGAAWLRKTGLTTEGSGDAVKVLVAGASGFVGRRLCATLDQAGHDVAAMTRNPARYRGAGTAVRGDVCDPAALETAMSGCQAAYYLVHSLQDADFERKDAAGATAFGQDRKSYCDRQIGGSARVLWRRSITGRYKIDG